MFRVVFCRINIAWICTEEFKLDSRFKFEHQFGCAALRCAELIWSSSWTSCKDNFRLRVSCELWIGWRGRQHVQAGWMSQSQRWKKMLKKRTFVIVSVVTPFGSRWLTGWLARSRARIQLELDLIFSLFQLKYLVRRQRKWRKTKTTTTRWENGFCWASSSCCALCCVVSKGKQNICLL